MDLLSYLLSRTLSLTFVRCVVIDRFHELAEQNGASFPILPLLARL